MCKLSQIVSVKPQFWLIKLHEKKKTQWCAMLDNLASFQTLQASFTWLIPSPRSLVRIETIIKPRRRRVTARRYLFSANWRWGSKVRQQWTTKLVVTDIDPSILGVQTHNFSIFQPHPKFLGWYQWYRNFWAAQISNPYWSNPHLAIPIWLCLEKGYP